MADEISLKEASDYLRVKPERVILLLEAREIEGRQQDQEWLVSHTSLVAYKARQQAQETAWQGIEEERNPMAEDEQQTPEEKQNPDEGSRPVMA